MQSDSEQDLIFNAETQRYGKCFHTHLCEDAGDLNKRSILFSPLCTATNTGVDENSSVIRAIMYSTPTNNIDNQLDATITVY
jgi:hypothetical protein